MEFPSPSHAWAHWLERPEDLRLVEYNATTVRAALDALDAGEVTAARQLWADVPGDELLAAWNAQVEAMRETSRWPRSLIQVGRHDKRIAPPVSRSLSRRVFERDGYRCGYCHIPVVTQWKHGDIPRLVDAFPDLTPHLKCVNGSIFIHTTPTNRNCAKWLWITAVADHIDPAAHGGRTDSENLVTSCGGCNYGKMDWTLEQLGVRRPTIRFAPSDISHPTQSKPSTKPTRAK